MSFLVIKQCGHNSIVYVPGETISDGVLDEAAERSLKAHGCIEDAADISQAESDLYTAAFKLGQDKEQLAQDRAALEELAASLEEGRRRLVFEEGNLKEAQLQLRADREALDAERQAFEQSKASEAPTTQSTIDTDDDKRPPKKGK